MSCFCVLFCFHFHFTIIVCEVVAVCFYHHFTILYAGVVIILSSVSCNIFTSCSVTSIVTFILYNSMVIISCVTVAVSHFLYSVVHGNFLQKSQFLTIFLPSLSFFILASLCHPYILLNLLTGFCPVTQSLPVTHHWSSKPQTSPIHLYTDDVTLLFPRLFIDDQPFSK